MLAFQHFETFKQRFAPFPLTVEMISRFRTAKQVKEILQRVEAGKVDILIGTDRLLSKDVKFADLGLLVVDEEQRFGVRHKERIKQMRTSVDVLTMSATPIPRTLHMSLVGLRDMSVIETPPKDRMAIQTVVANWDEKLIQSAIEQELDRGGRLGRRFGAGGGQPSECPDTLRLEGTARRDHRRMQRSTGMGYRLPVGPGRPALRHGRAGRRCGPRALARPS